MDLNHTMMQSQSPAAAADIDTSAVNQQQQQVSERRQNSFYTAEEEAAQPLGGSTAAAASSQASDRSQHMQHGIPGFVAMSPEQQSAAILAKWGMTPSPDLQMQLQPQQAPEQQQQQQPQTHQTQLEATPSHSVVAQRGGLTTVASPANAPDGSTTNPNQALPAALGASAPEASLPAALADVDPRDRTDCMQVHQARQKSDSTTSMNAAVEHHQTAHVAAATYSGQQPQGNAQGSSVLVSEHMVGKEEGLALEQPDGEGSSGNQLQRGAEGGSDLVLERTDVVEGGLGLEQPDGEGSNPLWTPEVVRGRVVRATEMWHRQRIQHEASQQVTNLCYLVSIHVF